MSVRLVKTIGGHNGAPIKCSGCGSSHFTKSRMAWHCSSCGQYYPAELGIKNEKSSSSAEPSSQNGFIRWKE